MDKPISLDASLPAKDQVADLQRVISQLWSKAQNNRNDIDHLLSIPVVNPKDSVTIKETNTIVQSGITLASLSAQSPISYNPATGSIGINSSPQFTKLGIGIAAGNYLAQINEAAGVTTQKVLSFSSADLAQPATTIEPTTVYGHIAYINPSEGGLLVRGMGSTVSADQPGILIEGYAYLSVPDVPAIKIAGFKYNGTGVTSLAATDNLLDIYNNTVIKNSFLGDGSLSLLSNSASVILKLSTDFSGGIPQTQYWTHNDVDAHVLSASHGFYNGNFCLTLGSGALSGAQYVFTSTGMSAAGQIAITGGAPLTLKNNGTIEWQGVTGGWINSFNNLGSTGTQLYQFGFKGSSNTFDYFYFGTDWSTPTLKIFTTATGTNYLNESQFLYDVRIGQNSAGNGHRLILHAIDDAIAPCIQIWDAAGAYEGAYGWTLGFNTSVSGNLTLRNVFGSTPTDYMTFKWNNGGVWVNQKLYVDHIGEVTGSHGIVCDSSLGIGCTPTAGAGRLECTGFAKIGQTATVGNKIYNYHRHLDATDITNGYYDFTITATVVVNTICITSGNYVTTGVTYSCSGNVAGTLFTRAAQTTTTNVRVLFDNTTFLAGDIINLTVIEYE